MKKYMIIGSLLFLFNSCTKNFDKINTNNYAPTNATGEAFLASAEKGMTDIITSANVNRNVYRQYAQYWTNTTYPQESRYDLITRAIPDNFWTSVYTGALKDCQLAKKAIAIDPLIIDENVRKAQTAIVDVWQCYAYHVLTSTFGNVPYSQALDIENLQPKYDDGLTIHKDLINRLSNDIAVLDTCASSFGAGDIIYSGDNASWSMFANTLKMKLGLMLADVPAEVTFGKNAYEETVGHTFTSNADNAIFHYLGVTPNNNPVSDDLYGSGLTNRKDFVAANTIVNSMLVRIDTTISGTDTTITKIYDPRMGAYFTKNNAGIYKGGIYGTSNGWSSNSKPSYDLVQLDAPALIMDYAEVEFMLAEGAERGWTVTGTAESHYNAGITASCDYWGVDATSYLAEPTIAYNTAAGTWKQKIGTQQWLAYYNRGFEGWTSWRRLDYPILNVPQNLTYADIPVRWTYPVKEQTLNGSSYSSASSAIGGDLRATKLYWDKQ